MIRPNLIRQKLLFNFGFADAAGASVSPGFADTAGASVSPGFADTAGASVSPGFADTASASVSASSKASDVTGAPSKALIGTWAIMPSSHVTDAIAATGLDFIVIDREHAPISLETAQQMVVTCEAYGVAPLIRVPDASEKEILWALDIGAHGLHIPNISNAEQVRHVIQWAKYPPEGIRGFTPYTRAAGYTGRDSERHVAQANSDVVICLHIEGKDGIANLDEILSIPEPDIIFIGIYDLSSYLGIPGQVRDPKIMDLLADIVERVVKAGKVAGCSTTHHEHIHTFTELGIRYIPFNVDCGMLTKSYLELLDVSR